MLRIRELVHGHVRHRRGTGRVRPRVLAPLSQSPGAHVVVKPLAVVGGPHRPVRERELHLELLPRRHLVDGVYEPVAVPGHAHAQPGQRRRVVTKRRVAERLVPLDVHGADKRRRIRHDFHLHARAAIDEDHVERRPGLVPGHEVIEPPLVPMPVAKSRREPSLDRNRRRRRYAAELALKPRRVDAGLHPRARRMKRVGADRLGEEVLDRLSRRQSTLPVTPLAVAVADHRHCRNRTAIDAHVHVHANRRRQHRRAGPWTKRDHGRAAVEVQRVPEPARRRRSRGHVRRRRAHCRRAIVLDQPLVDAQPATADEPVRARRYRWLRPAIRGATGIHLGRAATAAVQLTDHARLGARSSRQNHQPEQALPSRRHTNTSATERGRSPAPRPHRKLEGAQRGIARGPSGVSTRIQPTGVPPRSTMAWNDGVASSNATVPVAS